MLRNGQTKFFKYVLTFFNIMAERDKASIKTEKTFETPWKDIFLNKYHRE